MQQQGPLPGKAQHARAALDSAFDAVYCGVGLELQSGLTRTTADETPRLIVPVELNVGGEVLQFLSTLTTFGTAFDITLEELRIEALHPANERTAERVRDGTWF